MLFEQSTSWWLIRELLLLFLLDIEEFLFPSEASKMTFNLGVDFVDDGGWFDELLFRFDLLLTEWWVWGCLELGSSFFKLLSGIFELWLLLDVLVVFKVEDDVILVVVTEQLDGDDEGNDVLFEDGDEDDDDDNEVEDWSLLDVDDDDDDNWCRWRCGDVTGSWSSAMVLPAVLLLLLDLECLSTGLICGRPTVFFFPLLDDDAWSRLIWRTCKNNS